jgi:hypothetical protein
MFATFVHVNAVSTDRLLFAILRHQCMCYIVKHLDGSTAWQEISTSACRVLSRISGWGGGGGGLAQALH